MMKLNRYPYVRPADDSPEMQYLKKTRDGLGGPIPRRRQYLRSSYPHQMITAFTKLYAGTGERKISTTMAAVRVLTDFLKDKEILEKELFQ